MFIIEGNIGVGKTTFLKLLKKNLPFISVNYEPVQNWQEEVDGQSILTNFYKNPNRWAYSMELLTMLERIQEQKREQKNKDKFIFLERSVYSGHYCFAYNDYISGYLSKLEWNMYLQWFNYLVDKQLKAPKGFIYLKVDPVIAFERLKKRNRDCESTISLSYLQDINKRHEEFLVQKKNLLTSLINVPVLILDCNEEFEENNTMFDLHIKKIKDFIT